MGEQVDSQVQMANIKSSCNFTKTKQHLLGKKHTEIRAAAKTQVSPAFAGSCQTLRPTKIPPVISAYLSKTLKRNPRNGHLT